MLAIKDLVEANGMNPHRLGVLIMEITVEGYELLCLNRLGIHTVTIVFAEGYSSTSAIYSTSSAIYIRLLKDIALAVLDTAVAVLYTLPAGCSTSSATYSTSSAIYTC